MTFVLVQAFHLIEQSCRQFLAAEAVILPLQWSEKSPVPGTFQRVRDHKIGGGLAARSLRYIQQFLIADANFQLELDQNTRELPRATDQIDQLLPDLVAKGKEEVRTQAATTDQVTTQAALNTSLGKKADADAASAQATADYTRGTITAGGPQATVAGQAATTAQAQSQAALNNATVQQNKLGPLYGLQDQRDAYNALQAITQHAFTNAPAGTHTLYLVFTGPDGGLFNVNWFQVHGKGAAISAPPEVSVPLNAMAGDWMLSVPAIESQ